MAAGNNTPSGWLMGRWLALGTAAGAALSMVLEVAGLRGPWQMTALLLALIAVLTIVFIMLVLRRREAHVVQWMERAQRDHAEVSTLQLEIQRRTELEQQLTAAKQAAESAVLAKGEFLATMSHEIRTPLNGIVPMLDLLMHARLLPDQHELCRTAFSSSQQLLRIVDDILDYSKLEAHKLELESTTFNIRDLLESVVQLMERPAEAKGLRLHLHIDPGVRLPVRGDPVRLRQVLTNLVGNAVKFTDRGAISLRVVRSGETASQHLLRFEVRDSGIGITPEAQARLFRAFSQADASTTRLYGGTGLGLAICKRIIDLMGGHIGVLSTPGHGATFHFEIPLLKVHGDMPAQDDQLSGGRLLLLTADARLRGRLSMLLPNWGLRVTAVETTQEALNRLRAAASQGAPWTYGTVVADLTGMRNTALALHRNLGRQAMFGDVHVVYLYGDEETPAELRQGATLLPRLSPDAELRAALVPRSTRATATATPASTSTPATPALSTSAFSASAPAPAASLSASQDEARKMRGRVLLVEDNPVNLLVAQRLLGVLGLDCDTATNGEAALLRMHDGAYDLVLIDCQMPLLDGYAATRRWREHEATDSNGPRLPIIAMTANAMTGDRQRCLDAGMDDYLAKPVTRGQLEQCLQRWLSGARSRTAMRGVTPMPATDARFPTTTTPATSAEPTEVGLPDIADVMARMAPTPVLDEDVLEELYAVIGAEASRVVSVYLEDAPQLIQQLEQAALAPDFEALGDAAHSLKSSSANVGATALSMAARRIELGARTHTLDRPAVAVALAVAEYERVRTALQAHLHATRAARA